MADTSLLGHPFWTSLLEVIGINIVLSGDNAMVVALACRSLPPARRRWGIVLATGATIILRIALTTTTAYLLAIPFLNVVGGILLLWIAVKLVARKDGDQADGIEGAGDLWTAVRTVAVADAVMSLDNIIGIAAVVQGDVLSIATGLAVSIPFVAFCSTLIIRVIDRFPVVIWAGGTVLGWIAGSVIVKDPVIVPWIGANAAWMDKGGAVAGAIVVVALGAIAGRTAASRKS